MVGCHFGSWWFHRIISDRIAKKYPSLPSPQDSLSVSSMEKTDRWIGVRQIESIIGVRWRQENPHPRFHRSSGKRGLLSFPLEQWTQWLGFSCQHWTSIIGSFSHIPSLNSFENDSFYLFEHGSIRGTCRQAKQKNKISKVKQLWYQNVHFVLTKKMHTHTWYFYSQIKEL